MKRCRLPYCNNGARFVRGVVQDLCTAHKAQETAGKPFRPIKSQEGSSGAPQELMDTYARRVEHAIRLHGHRILDTPTEAITIFDPPTQWKPLAGETPMDPDRAEVYGRSPIVEMPDKPCKCGNISFRVYVRRRRGRATTPGDVFRFCAPCQRANRARRKLDRVG